MIRSTRGPIERFDDLPAHLVSRLAALRRKACSQASTKRDTGRDTSRLTLGTWSAEYVGHACDRAREGYTQSYVVAADDQDLAAVFAWLSSMFGSEFRLSGRLIYPFGGWLGWHTNADHPGPRYYFNHAVTAESFLRMVGADGRIVTDHDVHGWQLRRFMVPAWHCVFGGAGRFSLGTRPQT